MGVMSAEAVTRRISSPRLLGREAELRELRRLLDDARTGHGAAILLGGEAGIGKSRLTPQLAGDPRMTHSSQPLRTWARMPSRPVSAKPSTGTSSSGGGPRVAS